METWQDESGGATGVCNCCLGEGAVRSMIEDDCPEENYTQLLLLCYGLDVMAMDIGDTKRLICPACVQRLHGALQFRYQVEQSMRTLEEATQAEEKAVLPCKFEDCDNIDALSHENFVDDHEILDISLKDEELALSEVEQVIKLMRPSKRSRRIKGLTTIGTKLRRSIVETPSAEDVQAFLNAGLFPFKGRKGKYQCAVCNKTFRVLSDIKDHMPDHGQSLKSDAVKRMIRSSHNSQFEVRSSKLRCKLCADLIGSYPELEQHAAACSKRNGANCREQLPFKLEKDQLDCPICQKRFLNYVNLNNHMNVHYPNFICESCGKAFASKARLRGHMRIHEVGEFPCKFCEMVFDKVTKRENHVSKQHKSGVRYSCPRCGIAVASFYGRQKHLADAHNEELKRYKCTVCPQSYITPGHLSSHVRRDHLNERNHKCDKCDLAFYTRHSLRMHMIKHDGERIYSCEICSKSYQRAKTLKEHMRIHNNDKRFMCPMCGRAFTQKCTLKSHLKVHERKPDVTALEEGMEVYGRERHSV